MMEKHRFLESGQSFVELSFSFVLIMMLLAGIVDFGRAFFSYISIYDGAREGAVFASNFSGDTSAIIRHVRNTSTDPINLLEEAEVTINPVFQDFNAETIFPCAGDIVTVTVRYAFEFTMPFVSLFVPDNSFPLYASATSTVLSPACNVPQ
jgi:hypothetical protein